MNLTPRESSVADRSTSSRNTGKMRVLFESAVYSSPLQYREEMYLFVITGITALQLSSAVPMAPCQSLPELMSSQSSQTVKLGRRGGGGKYKGHPHAHPRMNTHKRTHIDTHRAHTLSTRYEMSSCELKLSCDTMNTTNAQQNQEVNKKPQTTCSHTAT